MVERILYTIVIFMLHTVVVQMLLEAFILQPSCDSLVCSHSGGRVRTIPRGLHRPGPLHVFSLRALCIKPLHTVSDFIKGGVFICVSPLLRLTYRGDKSFTLATGKLPPTITKDPIQHILIQNFINHPTCLRDNPL